MYTMLTQSQTYITNITNAFAHHKAAGYVATISGWNIKKYAYHRMCTEFIHGTKCFGVKQEQFTDIIPCGEVECISCRIILKLPVSEQRTLPQGRNTEHIPWISDNKIYCGKCILKRDLKSFISEVRISVYLDTESLYAMISEATPHIPIQHITCRSLSNKRIILREASVFYRDTQRLISDPTGIQTNIHHCVMLPGGILPSHVYLNMLAKRVIRRWRRLVQRRLSQKVSYVLYRCVPGINATTALMLGQRMLHSFQ
jgi:hypothetical protein